MPDKKVNAILSETEYNFVVWCRKIGFAECMIFIKDGEVIKAVNVERSHRFDIDQPI